MVARVLGLLSPGLSGGRLFPGEVRANRVLVLPNAQHGVVNLLS